MCDTLMVFLKYFFENITFEKKVDDKKLEKIPTMQKVNVNFDMIPINYMGMYKAKKLY